MKFFINLGINKKLIIVFSVVCIFMVLIGVEGLLSSANIVIDLVKANKYCEAVKIYNGEMVIR
ncbi:hypothetical protein [uncultured Clostridium sp.]|uniref:hypothetical protein n=1 Tax=uncultured Clostridium sp. TaxID=59620 RepID=UPI0028E4CB51|nr:hypothetical protein [uncultured Clostridium sp.]